MAVAVGLAATGVTVLAGLGLAIGVVWVLAVVAVTQALSAVFKAALYRFTQDLPVDPVFSAGDLSGAFVPK